MAGEGQSRNLADQVISGRAREGLEQADLADRMGVSLKTVQRIEAGKPVSPTTLSKLGDALHWPTGGYRVAMAGRDPLSVSRLAPEVLAALQRIAARQTEVHRKISLVPDVYDQFGSEAARAALTKLSTEAAALSAETADLLASQLSDSADEGTEVS
ncbi:helix-turn-helix transcriptional regulator [Amycolatopsis sp. NPDC059657]|uniref:helix-turn-helix transcriptional regulator n=1 Tax=Amycolatopsis sp. NPDC059657 TaxID=3346899 RepID=UPI0036730616